MHILEKLHDIRGVYLGDQGAEFVINRDLMASSFWSVANCGENSIIFAMDYF